MMNEFIPYGKQWIDDEDIEAVVRVLQSDYLTQGPAVSKFEQDICEYTGAKFAVAVSSATAALHLAVAVLEIPVGKEAITTPNTFVASVNCLLYNQLTPVFADIDADTWNLDMNKVRESVTKDTALLLPVHFSGIPVDMEKIQEIAIKRGLHVIEDAAHAIGSAYKNGKKVGSCCYSDMTVFSFHPVKTMTTGEGGVITTNHEQLYKKLLLLRSHGITKIFEDMIQASPGPWYYEMQSLGYNYRMTDIQAALGSSQLKKLDAFVARRNEIIDDYHQGLQGIRFVKVPQGIDTHRTALHLYILQIEFEKAGISRKECMEYLQKKNIGTQVHYIPVHLQPYYKEKFNFNVGDYPVAEAYYKKALSIPLFPKMSHVQVAYVIESFKELFGGIGK